MDTAEYVISIKNESLNSISSIVEQLQKLGATDIKILSSIGIITACLTKDSVEAVCKIERVVHVEASRIISTETQY